MNNVAHKSLVMVHYVCMLLSKTDVRLRSDMNSGMHLETTSHKDIVVMCIFGSCICLACNVVIFCVFVVSCVY